MRKQSPPRSRLKRTNKKPPSPSDDSYDALQNVDRCLLIRRYVECQFGGGGGSALLKIADDANVIILVEQIVN